MNRRDFIKYTGISAAGTIALGGLPLNLFAGSPALQSILKSDTNNNVLIFVQLHGGNDGLNTLIPVSQYGQYKEIRANIAIPNKVEGINTRKYIEVDNSIPFEQQVGLHPDMIGFKQLYDEGKAAVIQNVGYPNMNGSHFRGRDIVFMGVGGQDDSLDVASGWMGRYLNHEYPNYPDAYPSETMADPIALEIGNSTSLAFHREDGIPIGLNVHSPEAFYNLINSVGVDNQGILFPEGYAGEELRYLMEFETMTNVYAEQLKKVYDAGQNSSVSYPETYPGSAPQGSMKNPLSGQLRLIARLLAGGIKTRIFLCRIGGFDTHGAQVEEYDHTQGTHAALLYHLSSAMKAFMDDVKELGMEERVLAMTFTEFGRRPASNDSFGTDHGTSTPVFLFGKGLKGGVLGNNPIIPERRGANLEYEIDYRQIYTSVVQDWFQASDVSMQETGFSDWLGNRLDLFGNADAIENSKFSNSISMNCFPNPAHNIITLHYFMNARGRAEISILSANGKLVEKVQDEVVLSGSNSKEINISRLPKGIYSILLNAKKNSQMVQFVKE